MRILVYGTFRKGECRENISDSVRKYGTSEMVELDGLRMYDLGAYPGAVDTGNPGDKIVAELIEFEMPQEDLKKALAYFDAIEGVGVGLFKRHYVDTPKGKALIYAYAREIDPDIHEQIVDWVKHTRSEKSVKCAQAE